MSEQVVDIKQLIEDWNNCSEDDGFEGNHPILLLAMDVDSLRGVSIEQKQRITELEKQLASTSDKRDKDLQINAIDKILSTRLLYMYDRSDAVELYETGIRAVVK